jgi:hypothetical protein
MATAKNSQAVASAIQLEIERLATEYGYETAILQQFSDFIISQIKPSKTKSTKGKIEKKPKALSLTELKQAIFQKFGVADAKELKKSNQFKLATHGMEGVNLSKKDSLEALYRKLVGILPNEEQQEGYACINGINIFNYDMPWRTFGLNPKIATKEEIKTAYRNLSKLYHPDNRETGDAKIFDRLTIFYKSLTETF